MEQSRRAVESYWRSRLIDIVTLDEDKVVSVYKLKEICDLPRESHSSVLKELFEFILKHLQHKSPIVKQKIERLMEKTLRSLRLNGNLWKSQLCPHTGLWFCTRGARVPILILWLDDNIVSEFVEEAGNATLWLNDYIHVR